MIVLGKTAGIALGKQYLCGKIDKEKFERVRREILPEEFFSEQTAIQNEANRRIEAIEQFKKSCSQQLENSCQRCAAKKSIFRSMYDRDGIKLCNKCLNELQELEIYPGFSGEYLVASKGNVLSGPTICSIRPEHF